jgi:outer membrane protein assembly factor BamA
VVLVIRVEEKFYILPLPRFSRSSDGDISYGAKVSFDNLLGYNQSLELLYEETDVADDTRETEASIGYSIARIPGTDYGLSLVASRTTAQEEVIAEDGRRGRYDDERERYTLGVSRWLSRRAPSRGWRAAVGATTSRDDYTFVSGETGLREDERIVTLSLGIEHTAVEEYTYNRGGFIYGWRLGASVPALGSDEETKQVDFFWRRYQRLGADLEHNFNMQFRVGGAFDSSPLKQTFKLGGSDTLRGFEVDAFQGDTYIVANLEYLHTSPWTRRLRGAVFTDLGNAYPEGRIDLGDLEAGIGLGLRYKIPWLVRIDLRVDVAQGLGSEGILRVYAGTRASF